MEDLEPQIITEEKTYHNQNNIKNNGEKKPSTTLEETKQAINGMNTKTNSNGNRSNYPTITNAQSNSINPLESKDDENSKEILRLSTTIQDLENRLKTLEKNNYNQQPTERLNENTISQNGIEEITKISKMIEIKIETIDDCFGKIGHTIQQMENKIQNLVKTQKENQNKLDKELQIWKMRIEGMELSLWEKNNILEKKNRKDGNRMRRQTSGTT